MSLYEKVAKQLADQMTIPYDRTLKDLHQAFATEKELACFTAQIDADMQMIAPGFHFIDESGKTS